jgi:hypothetical protein
MSKRLPTLVELLLRFSQPLQFRQIIKIQVTNLDKMHVLHRCSTGQVTEAGGKAMRVDRWSEMDTHLFLDEIPCGARLRNCCHCSWSGRSQVLQLRERLLSCLTQQRFAFREACACLDRRLRNHCTPFAYVSMNGAKALKILEESPDIAASLTRPEGLQHIQWNSSWWVGKRFHLLTEFGDFPWGLAHRSINSPD